MLELTDVASLSSVSAVVFAIAPGVSYAPIDARVYRYL